jgi:PAS domain S-box-containing protein
LVNPSKVDPARAAPAAILIVEDEQIVALELRDRLTRMGHSVVGIVASGEDAIALARTIRPDLVLMDIKLQGVIDGIDAATAIRAEVDAAIVYLTAFADRETLERAKVTQPYGYILKPFQERELQVIIEVSLYRRGAERALRESELWRQALLRSVGDGVVASDDTGCVRFMNPVAETLTGWYEADAIGQPFADVLRTVQLPERRSGAWRDTPSTSLIAKDGTERPIDLQLTPISNGKRMGTVCVFRDARERRRRRDRQRFLAFASSELTTSLEREVVLARVASLVAHSWADWCAIHVTNERGSLQLGGFAHRDLSAKSGHASPGDAVRNQDATVVGNVFRTEAPVLERNISRRDWPARAIGFAPALATELAAASAIIVPLVARNRCLGTLTIVSERREPTFDASDLELAEELARRVAYGIDNSQLYSDARRATAMRDEVLALVTHDLRNPLSTITLRADQLLRAAPTAEIEEHATGIVRSARRMTRMVDDLLDVARVDAARMSLQLEHISTITLVAEAISTFEGIAAARSIRLDGASVHAADLWCDHGRILQVLGNLIGNALKFSPDGSAIRIDGAVRPDCFELSVTDHGMGIAPDQLERVFERHWQAPESRHRGSGLGLYIAKGIVEAHGGRIWVVSQPGTGSTFHFTIPHAPRNQALLGAPA